MHHYQNLSRREFIASAAFATSALALLQPINSPANPAPRPIWPIACFSKAYQACNLNFEETAQVTAEIGLDGIDCPVRPDGQILPERVEEDLPRMAEALNKYKSKLLLLTTHLTSRETPFIEPMLRTMSRLGIKFYRLGYWQYGRDEDPRSKLKEIKAQLKDLVALNKELGICGLLQNHSGENFVGAKVWDNFELVRDYNPEHIGIAFDVGHAMKEIKADWRRELEKLRSHLKIVYVKDFKRDGTWPPLGHGEVDGPAFFSMLKKTGYNAPISLHAEYELPGRSSVERRESLIRLLKEDLQLLKKWIAQA